MAYDNNDNKKKTKGRTLGLVVATAVAAVPVLGCSSDSESALTTDAGSQTDTAVAMDTASQPDATAETNVPEDASANDVYPDGVRG
jgi:hypothetical protein